MTYDVTPPKDGTYRIRFYSSSSGNSYWEFSPGSNSGVALKALNTNSALQKWKISKNGNGTYNISSSDGTGLTMYKTNQTYWGHGYPLGGSPSSWRFQSRTVGRDTFCKIFCSGNSEPLDSYYGEWVHFYTDDNGRQNQRWVFEHVPDPPPPYQKKNPNQGGKTPIQNPNNNGGGVSTDPTLSIMDNDGNELSAAKGNLDPNKIYVTNNSATMVKVHISNNSNTGVPKELNDFIMQVGDYAVWQRRGQEVLSVYRATDNTSGNFSTTAQTYNVSPGKITAIV